MIVVLGMSWAWADEVSVAVPFEPPATVPLFTKAEVVDARGSVKGPDCAAAVTAALAEAATHGTVVRVTRAKDDLAPAADTICKQRKAGDTVSASMVDLVAIVLAPGSPATLYRPLPPDRAIQIATLIGAVSGGGLGSAAIDQVNGGLWVNVGVETLPETLDSGVVDPALRGATVYERYVPPWVSRWAPVLSAIPELKGAVLEVVVTHEDLAVKKSRKTELYRFVVPTAAAASFLKGGLTDDAFLAASQVERAADARKRDFQPLALEIGDAGLPVAAQRPQDRGAIDVSEEDLEGVEDE